MTDIVSRLSRLKTFVYKRFKTKIKPIDDNIPSFKITSVSQNSLNERNVETNEDNYRRDSFEDRFCDDLSEVLFQFLSLEDKLRLQCVSNQFQRTVFQRHYELDLILSPEHHKILLKNINFGIRGDFLYYYSGGQSLESFNVLLKKCPNITSIQLNGSNQCYRYFVDKYSRSVYDIYINRICDLLQQMANNCLYLKSIECGFVINDKNSDIRQFLSQMKAFPALKRLNLCLYLDNRSHNKIYLNQFFSFDLFKDLSNITHLTLKLKSFEFLKQIALKEWILIDIDINLPKLQYLEIKNEFQTVPEGVQQMADILNRLSRLKTLKLNFYFFLDGFAEDIDINQLFSFESFKDLEIITHLRLCFSCEQLNESIFKDIDIYLPKLQYLEIWNQFNTTPEGVSQMAKTLSRLSRLQKIQLYFKSEVNFKSIEEQFAKKCRKIKEIKIRSDSDLVLDLDDD